jgi:hypothetical protein
MANEFADIVMGPVVVWKAPVGETRPDENAVAYGVAWGGNWTSIGYTKVPLSCLPAYETVEAFVEEFLEPVKRRRTVAHVTLETTLALLTADNLQLGMGGTVTDTPAGAAQVGKEELEAGNNAVMAEYAWGFEGEYRTDAGVQFPIRLFLYKGTCVLNGALEFGKATPGTGIPIRIEGLADASQSAGKTMLKIQKVLAAHT